MVMHKS
jgi:hypothetical protein